MRRSGLLSLSSLVFALGAAACTEGGVASIRIELAKDFSGTVRTSSLLVPAQPGPLEGQAGGVKWRDRVNLYSARGSFAKLDDLQIAGITFAAGKPEKGPGWLRVTLPRGKKALWPTALTPTPEQRAQATEVFDPARKNLASSITIQFALPATVTSNGVTPHLRGVSTQTERNVATLVVPVGSHGEEPFAWIVTWK